MDVGGLGDYLDKLTPEEKRIRETAFFSILNGNPVSLNQFREITGIPCKQIEAIIDELELEGLIEVDRKSGNVIGSYGISLAKTIHRIHINGQNLFTWCAADSIGIPSALDLDAQISSICFACKNPINIQVVQGEVIHASEPEIKLLVIETDLGKSLVGCTWPQINYFCSVEHFNKWRKHNSNIDGQLLSLTEATKLGKRWWSEVADLKRRGIYKVGC